MNGYFLAAFLVFLFMSALIGLLPEIRHRIQAEFGHSDRNKALVAVIALSGGMSTLMRLSGDGQTIEFHAAASLGFFLIYSGVGILAIMLAATARKEE